MSLSSSLNVSLLFLSLSTQLMHVQHDGLPALSHACFRGHAGIVQLLLEHGADVNHASDRDKVALAALLLHLTSAPCVVHPAHVCHPLWYDYCVAIASVSPSLMTNPGRPDVVKLCLEAGADARAENSKHRTPMAIALTTGTRMFRAAPIDPRSHHLRRNDRVCPSVAGLFHSRHASQWSFVLRNTAIASIHCVFLLTCINVQFDHVRLDNH